MGKTDRIREQLADLERFVLENIKPEYDIHPDLLWDAAESGDYELPSRLSKSGHPEIWLGGVDLTITTGNEGLHQCSNRCRR